MQKTAKRRFSEQNASREARRLGANRNQAVRLVRICNDAFESRSSVLTFGELLAATGAM
jgi:hypothetical protein